MALRISTRYLARSVYAYSAIVLIALMSLYFFFDFVGEIGSLSENYGVLQALKVILYTLPSRLYEFFPIGIMIGTLYGLGTMARRSELVVLRTSGMSKGDLVRTVMIIGLLPVAIHLFIGEVVSPIMAERVAEYKFNTLRKGAPRSFSAGLWMRDGSKFVGINRVLPNAQLEGVRIFEFDEKMRLIKQQNARLGIYEPPANWRLREGVTTTFDAENFNVVKTERVDEEVWASKFSLDVLKVLLVVPENMPLHQLRTYIKYLQENRINSHRYQLAWWRKIQFPFTTLVMMLLMLPFVIRQEVARSGRFLALNGIMLGIGYFTVNALAVLMGSANHWPILPTVLIPSLVATGGGLLWLWRPRNWALKLRSIIGLIALRQKG